MQRNTFLVGRKLWLACVMALVSVASFYAVASSASDGDLTSAARTTLTVADTTSPLCRLGFAGSGITWVNSTDLASLRASTYLQFNVLGSPYPGYEFIQEVRLHQVKTGSTYLSLAPYAVPYTYTLAPGHSIPLYQSIAAANRGSVWIIGNEIERRDWDNCNGGCGQDEILPELYAVAYHDLYEAIKSADPSARISNGSLVEITPLRLKYMDRVWSAYLQKYGTRMPVDVWNVHLYILREVAGVWGADIPAGLSETTGIVYTINQADSLDIFKQQLTWFRQWLASKGEQNKPLLLTEYGVLFPDRPEGYYEDDGSGPIYMTTARVQNFLRGTFDYMLTAKDGALGYANDDNHLVQRWYWYSLQDYDYGGPLFYTSTNTLNPLGIAWANYVAPLATTLDFKLLNVGYTLGQPDGSGTLTATINVRMSNSGNQNWTTPVPLTIVRADNGMPLASVLVNNVRGCGALTTTQVLLPNITNTLFLKAIIDPNNSTPDSDTSNNSINFTIIANPTSNLYLPLIRR